MRRYVEKRIAGRDTIIANKVTLDLSRRGPANDPPPLLSVFSRFSIRQKTEFY